MITLGIETSCDETSVALLETKNENGTVEYRVLAHSIFSQADLHAVYGGVFPILAKREHSRRLAPMLVHAIKESKIGIEKIENSQKNSAEKNAEIAIRILKEKEPELLESLLKSNLINEKPAIDRIAVTAGPGLEPALWVGINFARVLSEIWNIPIVAVNHMEGHIVASLMPNVPPNTSENTSQSISTEKLISPAFPAIALLISGGHTELVHIAHIGPKSSGTGSYRIVGATKDDAVGEAFDKVARMINLPYPGGPIISKMAATARARFGKNPNPFTLPRPMLHSPDLNFSFSGLKTSVLYLIKDLTKNGTGLTQETLENIALAFEDAATEVLVKKTEKAISENEAHALIVGGGVVANTNIRSALQTLATKLNIPLLLPPPTLSGDNALMIALAGALKPQPSIQNETAALSAAVVAQGNLSLEN